MVTRLAIRLYVGGVLESVERVSLPLDALSELLPELAEKHCALLAARPGHVEIEFLDEPDVNSRFFRIGTDPAFMREPENVDPDDPEAALRRWKGF